MPTMPQQEAGWRMEPPVSDPKAAGTVPEATATADPPEDPPGITPGSTGFTGAPKALVSDAEPMANSSRLVLPTGMAPAASSFSTAVASYGDWKFSSMREAQVVLPAEITMLSLTATGTPARGPSSSPASRRLSRARDFSSAYSGKSER